MNLNGTSNMSKMPLGKGARIEAARDAPNPVDQRGAALGLPIGQFLPINNLMKISIHIKMKTSWR
jgi:hypothetical protein